MTMMHDMTIPTYCEFCACDRDYHLPTDEVLDEFGHPWDSGRNGAPMTCINCYNCTTDPLIWLDEPDDPNQSIT